MDFNQLVHALEVVRDQLNNANLLDSDGVRVLDDAISQIKHSKDAYDNYQRRRDLQQKPITEWGFSIFRAPLRFTEATYKRQEKYRLRPDIICDMSWTDDKTLPHRWLLVLRVWSSDPDIMYREDYDAAAIGDLVTSSGMRERTMFRCHFDIANEGQSGPRYHMQIGGNAPEDEHCWFPKELDLPRFVHHPLDLVLLCQFVLANFFPEEYKRIRAEPAWAMTVKAAEKYLLAEYYQQCLDAVNGKTNTLLDALWN